MIAKPRKVSIDEREMLKGTEFVFNKPQVFLLNRFKDADKLISIAQRGFTENEGEILYMTKQRVHFITIKPSMYA